MNAYSRHVNLISTEASLKKRVTVQRAIKWVGKIITAYF
jgi:hypothetical protein